jgi:hypothetical protein
MPRFLLPLVLLLLVSSAQALDVDQLVQKNIEARGGLEAMRAMGSLKTTGRLNFSQGDFSMELGYVSLLRRDARLRSELSMQGLTQVTGYVPGDAWIINPFQDKPTQTSDINFF